jgi:hypothetical protein
VTQCIRLTSKWSKWVSARNLQANPACKIGRRRLIDVSRKRLLRFKSSIRIHIMNLGATRIKFTFVDLHLDLEKRWGRPLPVSVAPIQSTALSRHSRLILFFCFSNSDSPTEILPRRRYRGQVTSFTAISTSHK